MREKISLDEWKASRRFEFTVEEWREIDRRRKEQERRFGRNNGTFVAKKDKNYTGVGVAGEVAVCHYLTEAFGIPDGSVQLGLVGSKFDVDVNVPVMNLSFRLHVKTGAYRSWPSASAPFGVHADQGIQASGAGVVLVFLKRFDDGAAFGRDVMIAGFMPPWRLGECDVIERGQMFPGGKYPSKTRNIVTEVRDYRPIVDLRELAGPHPATRPVEADLSAGDAALL